MEQTATIISRVFDPFITLAALLFLTFLHGGVTNRVTWIIAFGLMAVVPVFLMVFAMRKKVVSNWDIKRREERPRVLGVILLLEFINILVIRPLVSPWVTQTLVGIFIVLSGFTLITLRWKISGHTLASALFTGAVIAWFGWSWWPILLIVPLVAWARVKTKNHTVGQVIAGAVYSWGLLQLVKLV
ncbi:hypothetical protein HY950_02840 [Candidatus Gottesmanbacteria bacterium]|nr:hypothetical protein [Candidatus Gottesmanbacteria bacterium]